MMLASFELPSLAPELQGEGAPLGELTLEANLPVEAPEPEALMVASVDDTAAAELVAEVAGTPQSDERRQKPLWPQVAMKVSELRRHIEPASPQAVLADASITPPAGEPARPEDASSPEAPSLKPLRPFLWREDEDDVAAGV